MQIFQTQFGSGFMVYVEGRPGPSGLEVGKTTFNHSPFDPRIRPDLQIITSRDLGDGSRAACDNSAPGLGGIPRLEGSNFPFVQEVADALNDFGCRYQVFDRSVFPCTQDTAGNFAFVDPNTTIQFCTLVSEAFRFPPGDTVLTVRLRDTGGRVGSSAAIVVRVAQ